jgi:hypothetical protein
VFTAPSRTTVQVGIDKLKAQGIIPEVQYPFAQLINYHRIDGALDHFLFVAANPGLFAVSTKTKVTDVSVDVLIPRRNKDQVPVLMNLWSGEMTPIALYTEVSSTQISVRISLKAYQSTMITMALLKGISPIHAVSTSGTSISRHEEGLFLRANTTGTFSTQLSDGRIVISSVGNVSSMQELSSWDLSVQSWEPTADLNSTATVYRTINVHLDTLTPWSNITELLDVSGIGTYKTSFTLSNWDSNTGAILSIPNFVGSFRLTINCQKLPPQDQLDTDFDVGTESLKQGVNIISIEVASTLLNRLRVAEPSPYGTAARQAYGLVGPVVLRPYRETLILCDGTIVRCADGVEVA